MPLHDGTTGLKVLGQTPKESTTNCSQQNLGVLSCARIQFEFEWRQLSGAESVKYTNDCHWEWIAETANLVPKAVLLAFWHCISCDVFALA